MFAGSADAADAGEPLYDPTAKPLFAFGSWEKTVMAQSSGPIELRGVNGKGGYGYNVSLDLTERSDDSIRLLVDVGSGNQAKQLRVLLRDADGTSGRFVYVLPSESGKVDLRPTDSVSISMPNVIDDDGDDGSLDVSTVSQVQILGDWRDPPLALKVLGVELFAPDAMDVEARDVRQQKDEEARRDLEQQMQVALQNITRGEDAPEVVAVAPLSPTMLQLTIRAGTIPTVIVMPYEPQEGDEINANPQYEAIVWSNGQGKGELEAAAEQLRLFRKVDGQRQHVGFITGDGKYMLPVERVVGDPLDPLLVDRPSSYGISSTDSEPVAPVEVHRKSKPFNMTHPDRKAAMEHRVILELAEPLSEGVKYTVHLDGINTKRESIDYTHSPRTTRSDSVHASHIGYAPSDPYKVATLSTWLGTGGGMTHDAKDFELLDESGETVFTGKVEEIKGKGAPERLLIEKDYTQTAVYALDFSEFDAPGTYRVFVPGVGTSGPVPISDTAWSHAFETSMMGLLHHRSGIKLGEPLTSYERPRSYHPADGVVVYELEVTSLDGESAVVNAEAKEIMTADAEPATLDDAWGGHMDAGDWDRNGRHLPMAHLLLELYELFPTYFAEHPLTVPQSEANNGLPDLIDEALWTIDLFARLQREDGGVSGGIEASAHPRDAEPSWMESLVVGAFGPDPYASYSFAANAAKVSRLIKPFDESRSAGYSDAAVKAWDWAEDHAEEFKQRLPKKAGMIDEQRELAAVEMLHLTGEAKYDDVFKSISVTAGNKGDLREVAAFAYARLPDGLGDEAVKQKAKEAVVELADRSFAFGDGNAFGISTPYWDLPMMGFVGYFSTPGTISRALPRAHALTGDSKYLAGTIRSTNFSAGANPDNMSYTTGLGWKSPQYPLHIDSRRTGQAAPAGITLYGVGDPGSGFAMSEWMHTYFLAEQMTPPSRTWPPQESYVDAFMWPEMNEYTIHQTIGPAAYTWGYLAAQAAEQQ